MELSGIFFPPNTFSPQLFEFTNEEPRDTEGQLSSNVVAQGFSESVVGPSLSDSKTHALSSASDLAVPEHHLGAFKSCQFWAPTQISERSHSRPQVLQASLSSGRSANPQVSLRAHLVPVLHSCGAAGEAFVLSPPWGASSCLGPETYNKQLELVSRLCQIRW